LKGGLSSEAENGLAVDGSVGINSLNNAHKRYVNKDAVTQLRSFPCRKCDGVAFASLSLRSWHNIQMHREHPCQKCGLVFTGRSDFAKHVHKEHPGLPLYKVFITCTGIRLVVSFLARHVIYTSCAYATMSVSICL